MNKKGIISLGVIILASLAGVVWYGNSKEQLVQKGQLPSQDIPSQSTPAPKDKTLPGFKKTGIQDLEGPYKKVSVSDGEIAFSFEVPDEWLTETRNAGEVEMTEEELREYLATNYDGDIKAEQVCNDQVFEYETGEIKTENVCYKPYSDYSGNDWDALKGMSYKQLKGILDLKKRENSPVPNATVSLSNKIWYTDIGWDQVNFYLVSKHDGLQYIENSKRSQKENAELQDPKFRDIYEVKWHSETIDGKESLVVVYPRELSDTGEWRITKGGTGGSRYYISLGDFMLIIWKEAYVEGKFEEGFQRIVETLRFHE